MTQGRGLYVHIPFCVKKCAYCDFPSFVSDEGVMARVVDMMASEMVRAAQMYPDTCVETLYIGGGTPSVLPAALMERLLGGARQCFAFAGDAEISCEVNPGTVTEAFLDVLKRGGVNRVSMGVQCAQDGLLRRLGRIHTFLDAKESVARIKAHGIDNINLDMMMGLPGQTLQDVRETLDAFLALRPTHISAYGLIVEQGTPLCRAVEKGEVALPDEDVERAMYALACQTLEENGFLKYEISNFARAGFACRHNVDCWRRHEYIGIGCAACGFIGDVRYKNPATLQGYLSGDAPEITRLSAFDARFESLMLGLRMISGVRDEDFEEMHGMSIDAAFGDKLKNPALNGLLVHEDGMLVLTERGRELQNTVLVALM